MNTLRIDIRQDFEYSIRTYSPDKDAHGGLLSEYDVLLKKKKTVIFSRHQNTMKG